MHLEPIGKTPAPPRQTRSGWRGRLAAAGIAATMLGLCAPTAASAEKVVIAAGSKGPYDAIIYVAQEAGYFAEEGLEPEIVYVNNGAGLTSAIMGGSADLATQGITQILRATAQGGDIIALSRAFDVQPFPIVVSYEAMKKNGIEDAMSVDDKLVRLKGLTIGATSPGSTTDGVLRGLLKNRGVNPDSEISIQYMNASSLYGAFENKLLDGFVFGAPWSEAAEANGLGKAIFDPFSGEVPEIDGVIYKVICTSSATLAAKPDLIKRSMRALIRAMDLIHTNPEEARKVMRPVFAEMSDDAYNLMFDKYMVGVPANPELTPDHVIRALDYMVLTESTEVVPVPFEKAVNPAVVAELVAAN